MTDEICLDENYSTIRLATQQKPEIINNHEDKFETVLFSPMGENRKGEGGLRTKGYFKKSYADRPLVGIITVVFNGKKYLEETIQSVINQSYDNVEYIIIDGGSTDGTLEIIKKYEDQIDYWVSEPDKGIYDAMNKGIGFATGEFIGLLNADDFYVKDTIEKVINKYQENQTCDIFYGNLIFINPDTNASSKEMRPNLKKLPIAMYLFHPACFVKKEVFLKCGLFDADFKIAADYDFLLRCYLQKYKFCYIDSVLTYMHEGGISSQQENKTKKEESDVRKKNLPISLFFALEFSIKVKRFINNFQDPKS